jgi:CHAT domain-containing protein/Tfp pilus assembly protein PilF
MPFEFGRRLCCLILSLSLINSALAQPQARSSVSGAPPSLAESAVRAAVEKYFSLYAGKDLDGLMNLWSEKSPDYGSLKHNLQRQFATEECSFGDPMISRVKVEIEKASLRATVNQTAIDLKSGQKRELRTALNFVFVREDGNWKVWRSTPAEDDLAEALVKAGTEAERAELLAEEEELKSADLARALIDQGGRFHDRGEYPQALIFYNLGQSIAEPIGGRHEILRVLRYIGHVHRAMGNNAQAMECFQKSLAVSEALDDQAGIGLALNSIGLIHMAQGNYTQALEHYQNSLTIFETLNNKESIARVLDAIGSVHRYQGDFAQALDCYRKSLEIAQELDNKHEIMTSLGNIGVIYSSQGNHAQALDHYQKSLAISEAEDYKEGIAISLGNIGGTHSQQGNYAQALDYYRKSLAMSEAIGDKVGIAQMSNSIGDIYYRQGDNAQALERYRNSLAIREESGDKRGSATAMMAIGAVYASQGNHAQALEYYQKSLAIEEAIRDREGVANTLLKIGVDHKKQGRHSLALDFASRAAALARQIGEPAVLWEALANVGLAYRALNQSDQARLAFEEAIAVIETMRGQVAGSEQEQQRFFEDKLSSYHAMVDLLVAQNNPTEALNFTERAKARALLDLLYSGRVNITKAMSSQEQEQERRLRAELISLNTQVTRASQEDNPDQAKLSQLNSLREKARLKYEAFQTSLYAAHSELKAHRGEAPIIKAEEWAALLPGPRSALLEYTVTEDKIYLFAITKSPGKAEPEVRVYTLPIRQDELAMKTEAFRRQLAARDLGFRPSAAELYELLLKPAEAQINGKTNLVIVPDNKLWELPFQALLADGGRFLIEKAAISYAPSLTALREMTKRRKIQSPNSASPTLLAMGNPLLGQKTVERATIALRDEKLDPLPEAEEEVKALGRMYGKARSKVYIGRQARENRAKTEAGQATIIHFATHGTMNNASPMYSHLVLAQGDTDEDGLLEAWELMRLDLKADLAALSACETARGRFGAGEGMIGLTWALFVAGVPSTVVSQWKVESASARELMLSFHRSLLAPGASAKWKMTKAEALRQAALKLMKIPETGHPFYWAGFVLVGDGR